MLRTRKISNIGRFPYVHTLRNISNELLIPTVITIIGVIIFDLLVSSSSIFIYRVIFDIAFIMVVFVFTYISVLLFKDKKIDEYNIVLHFPKTYLILPILYNLKTVISIIWFNSPFIGYLNNNMFFQSVSSLLPLMDFLILLTVNGVFIYFAINKKNSIFIYEIAMYILCVIAIETSLAIYCFQIGNVIGIRLGLSMFHMGLSAIFIWLYYNSKIKEIQIKVSTTDILLTSLSVGFFLMVYFYQGVYNIFTDQSVVTASTLGIIFRGNLNPYYESTNYYSPIGGFVSTVFAFVCGLDNILLASILPFFVSHLLLPFVTYHFMKAVVTDDSRIAIVGVVMSLLMDGLAVILLPNYGGNLNSNIIKNVISIATKSLYNSSLNWIMLKPFNILGMASAIATCITLNERKKGSLFLGGALLSLSFVNPRQPFLTALLIIFMFGIKRVSLKELGTLFSATVISIGPVITTILYVVIKAIIFRLQKISFITEDVSNQYLLFFRGIAKNPLQLTTLLIFGSLVTIVILFRLENDGMKTTDYFISKLEKTKKKVYISISKGARERLFVSFKDIVFLGLFIATITYIVLYAYGYLHPMLANFVESDIIAPLNYIVIRYHILLVLILVSFLEIKYDLRTLVTLSIMIIFAYLGLLGDIFPLHVPVIFVITALPVFNSYVKNNSKKKISLVLLFVFFGVFSASLYSATVNTTESDPRIIDLPNVLHILLDKEPEERVFTPSYHYYVKRVLEMANIQQPRPSTDPSSELYLIDNLRISQKERVRVDSLINNNSYNLLYNGKGFSLLEKAPTHNNSTFINDLRVNPSESLTLSGIIKETSINSSKKIRTFLRR